ncbi:MAG: hypothetical protein F4X40_00545, partial [Chloroflexi bacterium]|nr:hypothetical protein [Chloroflexota bacterium]
MAKKDIRSKTLALLVLVVALGAFSAMQLGSNGAARVNAATGVIDALNVGTCLATDAEIFEDEDCQLFNRSDRWEIRDEIEDTSELYATYAHDPKTGWDEPRAIIEDSDLLKISIHDPGRDRRTGVLIRGEGHNDIQGDLAAIKNLLVSRDLIESDETVAFETGTRLTVRGSAGIATIDTSGSHTLNFTGSSTYKPMDVDGNIRFFGCITAATECVNTGSGDDVLTDVSSSVPVDEDRTSGSINPDIAPWMAVNPGVPAGSDMLIYAVYYETSGREVMIGDSTYYHCGGSSSDIPERDDDRVWRCGSREADERNTTGDVEFTSNEIDGNDELTVRVSSDGDEPPSVNVYLTETGLFTGRYEGYVRLTDANGDGTYPSNSADSADWGAKVRDGSAGSRETDAAVIGVASGPVTIEYRDSGGRRRSLRISIDYEPPRIEIQNPVHLSASDDHSPDFIGSFDDHDSGLAKDSFRLVVDNDADSAGNTNFADFALYRIAPSADNVRGSGPNGSVSRRNDYIGYSTSNDDPFGVVDPGRLYDLGDDSCRDQDRCHILADDFRDGASSGRFDDTARLRLGNDALEFGVDFQAFVMDVAGNVGFSDSDPDNPYFINDLGQEDPQDRIKPNVLGYYSAHIFGIDEKDPEIVTTRSATGYYGLINPDEPIPDRRGIMLVFDGPISASSVSLDTFYVELDDGSEAEIVD